MASTQDQLDPSLKWLNVAGSLGVLVQGVAYLARKEETILGVLLLLMGGTLLVSMLRKRAVAPWIRAAVLGLMAIGGIAEMWLRHWIWGSFLLVTGLFFLFGAFSELRRSQL